MTMNNEMFLAEKGKGAFLNGQKIQVSDVDFSHALVGVGTAPYQEELAGKSMELALAFNRRMTWRWRLLPLG
ncbi:MAG: hypothetical protein K2P19_04865 [Kineothrix sp.]|mgnify:CR=1 FL=1|nr:hypothetical protein [Kineothrix sp.]